MHNSKLEPAKCPVTFDHYSEEFAENPWPIFRDLRQTQPVAWSDAHGGFWVVSTAELIEQVSRDHVSFSTKFVSVPKALFGDELVVLPPLSLDPPEHTAIRKLLLPAFSTSFISKFEPGLREFCRSMVDGFVADGRCDAAHDYSRRIPIYMLQHMIGLDSTNEDRFSDWIRRLVENSMALDPADTLAAGQEIAGYIAGILQERAKEPRDDLVSRLLQSEVDGERLTPEQLIGSVVFFITAGIDTTWGVLGAVLWHLAQHDEDRQRLVADPGLIPSAVEEFVRYFAPANVARVVKQDVVVGRQQMREGDSVLLLFPSACRDEAVIDRPDEVILDRGRNQHMAFGTGAHHCLGAPTARLELRVGLEEWLSRIPDFRIADAAGVRWSRGHVRGARNVPLILGDASTTN